MVSLGYTTCRRDREALLQVTTLDCWRSRHVEVHGISRRTGHLRSHSRSYASIWGSWDLFPPPATPCKLSLVLKSCSTTRDLYYKIRNVAGRRKRRELMVSLAHTTGRRDEDVLSRITIYGAWNMQDVDLYSISRSTACLESCNSLYARLQTFTYLDPPPNTTGTWTKPCLDPKQYAASHGQQEKHRYMFGFTRAWSNGFF